jgi:hypothetical protein
MNEPSIKQPVSARSTFLLQSDLIGLRVRLRTPEGLYLSADSKGWTFLTDRSRASVFDYVEDKIEENLKSIARVRGLVLKATPVEPTEILEVCDECHGLVDSPSAFFDGKHFFCPYCRVAARVRGRRR